MASISRRSARAITPADFTAFDWLVALDRGHHETLVRRRPADTRAAVRLFMDFLPGERGDDVPDPYYGDRRGFEAVFALIERGGHALVAELQAAQSTAGG